jgi:hypothetical protein
VDGRKAVSRVAGADCLVAPRRPRELEDAAMRRDGGRRGLGATTHLRDGDDGVVELGYDMSHEGDGGGGYEWECGAAEFVGVRVLLEKVYITPLPFGSRLLKPPTYKIWYSTPQPFQN